MGPTLIPGRIVRWHPISLHAALNSVAAVVLAGAGIGPASAEVFVLGNTHTGHVVIRGNTPDAAEQAHHEAKAIRDTGWVQLFGDDALGWGAVSCVIQGGRYHFFFATGQTNSGTAGSLAKAAGDRFKASSGGSLIFMCAPRWDNRGQPLAFGGGGHGSPAEPPERKPTVSDIVIGVPQSVIRNKVRKDYRRDCLPPPEGSRAEIVPSAPGIIRAPDKRPPANSWKPADWCPPFRPSAAGKRG